MRKLLSLILVVSSLTAMAQTGSIVGVVKDKAANEPIIGANVVIQGTQLGVSTDIEGNFELKAAPGTYTIVVSFVTYKTLTFENIVVTAGGKVILNVDMEEEAKQLDEVVVKAKADRSMESTLLMDRKKSVQMVQGIGAQELSRKGVSNAEAAVVQITGISKQQGVKNVFVRGLGDRYNSTSLNGLPLPSEDPEYKNITLDFFSSDIINNIEVNKTFRPTIYGDVGGANINIVSKKLADEQELSVSTSFGVNSQTVGNKNFLIADGSNYFGKVDKSVPITDLRYYDFKNSYQPNTLSGPKMNSSFSISGGKNFRIGNNSLKTFVVASSSTSLFSKEGVARQVNPNAGLKKDQNYKKDEYNVAHLLLGSASYQFGDGNEISYNTILVHDNKESVGNYVGFTTSGNDDEADPNAWKSLVRRQQVNNNLLFVNQLVSTIKLAQNISLDVRGSFNTIRGDEPDRRSNLYVFNGEEYSPSTSAKASTHRYFSTLKENDAAASAVVNYNFKGKPGTMVSAGYNLRSTNRDFESTQFNFNFLSPYTTDVNNPDAVFNQASVDNGTFYFETGRGRLRGEPNDATLLNPFTYNGNRVLHAGFASFDYKVNSALTFNLGVRVENMHQKIQFDTNTKPLIPSNPDKNIVIRDNFYFLPSFNTKYDLNDNDIVRLAASKTYTYPQFKEVAPFLYEDINFSSFGNPGLRPAENTNIDLRFEHYFTGDQLIAVTGFYKHIKNAINRSLVNSAAWETSYVNTGNANVAGAEVEIRKGIFNAIRGEKNTSLNVGLNVSYLYSKQDLKDVKWDDEFGIAVTFTDKTAALEGASSLLTNFDVTFLKTGPNGKRVMSSLVLNYFSDRIYSLGAPVGNNNIMENGIPRLDWISKINVNQRLSVSLNIRNILNPESKLTKEIANGKEELISSFRRGVSASIGLSYNF